MIGDSTYTIKEFTEYLNAHPERLLELINGRIVEKVVGRKHGKIVLKIGARLVQWVESNQVQGHYGTEVHHQPDDDTQSVLLPDVSFEYTDAEADDQPVQGLPDFVVEVKSPGNTYESLRTKARFYIEHGTRLVWLVYPARQIVEVYYSDDSSELFRSGHMLSGGDVLPGFTMTVDDMFNL